MIDISFEINGRKVNPNSFGDAIEKAIINSILDSIKSSVQNIKCSEHGESPSIKVSGKNIDNLSMEVSGCCETLIKQVSRKLK